MKYKLQVSYNCGSSYGVAKESDDLEELEKEGRKFDEQKLRWAIEDENGEQVECCAIHKGIIDFMEKVRTRHPVPKKEDVDFEQFERRIQESLLSWVVKRDEVKAVLSKFWARAVLGKKVFQDMLEMYRIACEGVEQSLESVKSLKKMRRLRFRVFVIERIQKRRREVHEGSHS
jgi:hypothetical protein